jgi:hypothetical protein
MRRLLLALLILLPCSVEAQTASYTYINQKAPYGNPANPWLKALGLPKIGTTFQVRVPGSNLTTTQGEDHWLAFGVRNPNFLISEPGFLYSSAEIVLRTPKGKAFVTMSFPIPNSVQLLGSKFYQQVLQQSSCRPSCRQVFSFSRGGVGTIGK